MERREFLTAAGLAAATGPLRISDFGLRIDPGGISDEQIRNPQSAIRNPQQSPSLGPEVFARRLARLRAELITRGHALFVAEPSTTFRYLAGYNPGRSERLILLMVPASGTPALVCPSFEVERIQRNSVITDVRGWEEHEDPWALVRDAGRAFRPAASGISTAAVEPGTSYRSFLGLQRSLEGWRFVNGAPVAERLRIIKAPEELALIRRAIAATEAAIAATFGQLAVGMTERDVAQLLSREMARRDSPGGGLVQFGPSSALPHGGPSAGALTRETVVLIDAGSRVEGYTSDITRTIWFGERPSEEFKRVYNLVHDAQTAAMTAGRPGVTACQELDRLARKTIADAGYGRFFTHRLGHGMGMDGHEEPYLVEGNETILEPGMVFTIEPGIYQLGKWGVRIEDDCVMTESGIEVMSRRPGKI